MYRNRPGRALSFHHYPSPEQGEDKQFDQLEVSSLFCPRCKTAVPIRKRLLLVLPEGERYE